MALDWLSTYPASVEGRPVRTITGWYARSFIHGVSRSGLMPSPAPAPQLPVGRVILFFASRAGQCVPPNQASTSVNFGDAEFNQGLINGG